MLITLATALALADDPAPAAPEATPPSPEPVAKRPLVDLEHVDCHYALGLAVGTYYGNLNWNDVGSVWGRSLSPTFEAACAEDPASGERRAWAGVFTAPFYVQFNALDGIARQQWYTGLVGVTWGHSWQVGPVVALGYPGAGGGLVVRRSLERQIVDARLLAYGPFSFGLQAQIVYGFVPRKRS